jgi:lipopolysaccharide transport system permease protein
LAETVRVPAGAGAALPVLELTGESTPIRSILVDLWRRRSLIRMLAAKDFHARYRSAALGVLWSVAIPVLQGIVLSIVFTKLVKIPITNGVSYPVFVLSGTVMWSFFSGSLNAGSTVIVDQGQIAGKVYFPRLILSIAPPLANTVSFALSALVLVPVMLIAGVTPKPTLLLFPAAMALLLVLVVLLGSITSLLHVYFRDTRYVVQASLMVMLYATPVIYPLEKAVGPGVNPIYHWLLLLNPVTGPLVLARWCVFGHGEYVVPALLSSLAWCVGLTVVSLLAYRRHERIAVDRL